MHSLVPFDYSAVDEICRDDVRDAAVRIKVRMARTVEDIIEVGRDLAAVKKALGHGHFLRWIEAEFGMSNVSATRFINVADRFGDRSFTVKDFQPSVLYALAAPSTDDALVEQVMERTANGETFTAADVARLRQEAADAARRAAKAEGEAKSALDDARTSKMSVERLTRQVQTLEESADLLRQKAKDDAISAAALERQRVERELSEAKEQVERIRAEVDTAVNARAEAATQAAMAKINEDVQTARRKEAEAKTSVDRLTEQMRFLEGRISNHQEYLSKINGADIEAKDLLNDLDELTRVLAMTMLAVSDLDYTHGEPVMKKVRSTAEQCRKMADALDVIGRLGVAFDGEVLEAEVIDVG